MDLIHWSFRGDTFAFLQKEGRDVLTTTPIVHKLLNVHFAIVYPILREHRNQFDCLLAEDEGEPDGVLPFLRERRLDFGISETLERVPLWTEKDLLLLAHYVRTPLGDLFQAKFVDFIVANARKHRHAAELLIPPRLTDAFIN